MTTRLEIINAMLGSIGEASVTSDESMHPSAIQARNKMEEMDKEFQSKDWWFNHDYGLVLTPSPTSGEIIVPSNALSISPVKGYVWRGTKLYDPDNHTYNIGEPVTVELVSQLPIEELPEVAGTYLKHLCRRSFYLDDDGDNNKVREYRYDEERSWAFLQREHLKMLRLNAHNRPSVAGILYRITPASGYVGQGNVMYPGGRNPGTLV